jgi:spermidine synthase
VRVVHQDAFTYLEDMNRKSSQRFRRAWDFIIADLPDPNNESLSKLYSVKFYRLIRGVLSPDGIAVTQATSPFHARKVFWCIEQTIRESGFPHIYPYHLDIPSFGIWGMIAFSRNAGQVPGVLKIPADRLRYLRQDLLEGFYSFPGDMKPVDVRHSTLFRPAILEYYEKSWRGY